MNAGTIGSGLPHGIAERGGGMADGPAAGGRSATDAIGATTQKGVSAGAVGLGGAVIIGVSCVAPAYTLTAAAGPIVAAVGYQSLSVILLGFIPMLLVALGYREINAAMPDNGTSFTWVTAAFGPWLGWMAGWGLIASTVLVLSSSAGVAVDFWWLMLSEITARPAVATLAANPYINVATCFVFMGLAAWISCRGMEATTRVQAFLVVLQVVALCAFGITAIVRAYFYQAPDFTAIDLSWFNPVEIPTSAALAAGLSLSIFMFWGWDVTLTMNEETRNPKTTPGLAAAATVAIVMLLYILTTAAALTFAGIGTGKLGLGNIENQRNMLLALAHPVFGRFTILVSLAVLCSSAACLQSTVLGPSRTMLAMSFYKALPAKLGHTHPVHRVPTTAVLVATVFSSLFYALMRFTSENVLWDTISAIGLLICFYYGLTAFAVVRHFRDSWFDSARTFLTRLLFSLAGGISLAILFVKTLFDSLDPGFGSGSHIGSVGLVFVIGMLLIVSGLVVMGVMALRQPGFFRAPLAQR